MRQLVIIAILGLLVTGCGAPIFRSEEDRFAEEPEIIEQLRPYLADWATLPPERTSFRRKEMVRNVDGIMSITVGELPTTDGHYVTVVGILLEEWGDWSRGYFYVHENGVTLAENESLKYRQLDEHLYIYNSTN